MELKASAKDFVTATRPFMKMPEGALTDPEASAEFLRRLRSMPSSARAAEPVATVVDRRIEEGPAVRVYVPGGAADAPVLLYFHGGGWVAGDLAMHDSTCRRLANLLGCAVVNVDYRLAPEHPYPLPLDDAAAALAWAAANAAGFGGDPARLIVAGSSAGGNLAAAAALRARDEGGPRIALQVLLYPAVDASMSHASVRELATGYGLESPTMRWYWRQYLGGDAGGADHLASPLAAPDLSRLPDAVVVTAEFDPLRDEGDAYARRLEEAGSGVTLLRFEGQVHGFLGLLGVSEDADRALASVAEAIRARLGRA
ncbi:alpha/beta hydrolase [Actinomadura livida]|uniref:Acetyl esterase n=1 Tax=Actinomadura livida TaxID=79909 RepID=A0A7W7IFA8_9ACTN|nr:MULTISPECIES: alpha/beta hydrolase [Actinomadura]MBB4775935.1 acetyl esterase [Actinomadura catellatispora]GGU16651.1 acetylhydrolase [Actinomadura livida]